MKCLIYKWFCVPLLFLFAGNAIGQNVKLDLTQNCANSEDCNPFVNSYACSSAVLQATHGSPAFYKPDTKTRQIQLEALISTSSSVSYGEGFTVGYHFSTGKKYTIKITHKGMPSSTGGNLYPKLIAALTNKPPRFNDGCDLGYLTKIEVGSQYELTVSSTSTTSTFEIQPTSDIFNLWLRSSPVAYPQAGLLISSIEIVDQSVSPPPPPSDPVYRCENPGTSFCGEKYWSGTYVFRTNEEPLILSCDAFKTRSDPNGSYFRGFTCTKIYLEPGFIASGYDYQRFNPRLKILASANPCRQYVGRIAVTDSAKQIKEDINIEQQLPDNITIYPSPSKGMVKIACNNQELLHAAITVMDQSGRVVYQISNSNNSNVVDLNLQHLSNGMYFIKVYAHNKVAIKKLLISK